MSKPLFKLTNPFWKDYEPDPEFDIRLLKPSSLPRGERFETLDDAIWEKKSRIQLLEKGSYQDRMLGDVLAWHHEEDQKALTCDPVDMLGYRIWSIAENLRLLKPFKCSFTIHPLFYDRIVPFGHLSHIEVLKEKNRLRRQIERLIGPHTFAMGGFEVQAIYREKHWLLHAHLTLANCNEHQVKKLRNLYRPKEESTRLLKLGHLKDRSTQVSYYSKFMCLRHPPRQSGKARPKGYRLHPAEHNEHMQFLAAHSPMDFLFVMNASRKNTTHFDLNPRLRNGIAVSG